MLDEIVAIGNSHWLTWDAERVADLLGASFGAVGGASESNWKAGDGQGT
jgi:hypothetical protein